MAPSTISTNRNCKVRQKTWKTICKYPISINEPLLEKNETLDFEGDKDEPVFYKNLPEKISLFVEEKQLNSSTIIPLDEGIRNHRNKNYAKAWECIKENAEIGNKEAKFWKGYYLTHGYNVVTPDPEQAMELFKEVADYGHVETQLNSILVYNSVKEIQIKLITSYIKLSID